MEDMKTLRRPTKMDVLLNLFDEIGATYSVREVCEVTGIRNYNSLKALLSYIRNKSHIPSENRIDVRIKDELCTRVN